MCNTVSAFIDLSQRVEEVSDRQQDDNRARKGENQGKQPSTQFVVVL